MLYEPTMLDIGHSKQIFVDDLVIESVENVCRTWHQPTRAGNPVIVRDRPWEQITYLTFNGSRVVRDPRDGIFKCVYQIWNRGDTPLDPPAFHLLYAESEDGVHWRKPELDVFRHDGRNTNIVIPNAYGMTYILDPHEEDPAHRFKAIYLSYLPKKLFESTWKVMAATSDDLMHWTDMPERPQMGRAGSKMDDSNSLSYDPFGRIFILNMRHYDMYAIARNLDNPELEAWTICPALLSPGLAPHQQTADLADGERRHDSLVGALRGAHARGRRGRPGRDLLRLLPVSGRRGAARVPQHHELRLQRDRGPARLQP